jgi:hypothetical protein
MHAAPASIPRQIRLHDAFRLKLATCRSVPVKATRLNDTAAYLTGAFVKPLPALATRGFPSVTNSSRNTAPARRHGHPRRLTHEPSRDAKPLLQGSRRRELPSSKALRPRGIARAIRESQSETRCSREAANEEAANEEAANKAAAEKIPAAATVFVRRVGEFNALYEVRRGQRKTDVEKARHA